MADNFFKVKNGLNLPTLTNDPTSAPPANSASGDMAFYNGRLYTHNGTSWGIRPGSGSTGLVVNADVDSAAAIAGTKISPNFGSQNVQTTGNVSAATATVTGLNSVGVAHTDALGNLSTSLIVNADVATGAAIDGTKVNPSFGSQNITTTGNITGNGASSAISGVTLSASNKLTVDVNTTAEAVYIRQTGTGNVLVIEDQGPTDSSATFIDTNGNVGIGLSASASLVEKLTVAGDVKVTTGDIKLDTAKGIESSAAASTLNIGTGTNTQTLNLGTGSGTQTVNIGTGAGTTTINIGGTGDSVVVAGTLTTVNTTNLDVADKNITVNKGGTDATAAGAGLTVEGTSGASRGTFQYDSTLTSKFKLGASGSEAEVVTVSDSQTLSNKTVGTVTAQSGVLTVSGTGALTIPVGTAAQQPAGSTGMIRFNSTSSAFEGYDGTTWSSIGGATTIDRVTQASHGFAIGDVLYLNGSTYTKAIATAANTAEVAGMVSKIVSANVFELTIVGEVSGLTGLTVGENYFLSASSAGGITATEPTTVGYISLPVGVASSSSSIYFHVLRGTVVGAANARTTITVINSGATSVVDVTNYNSLKLEGELNVNRSSGGNQRAYYTVEATKNGAGTWQVSAGYTGDDILYTTLPTWDVSGTQLQVTMPTVTNFTSASLTYSLNAPAVGASLPLSVDSTALNIVADAPLSYRNLLINGSMSVDQRNAGATQTFTAAAALAYSVDRWYGYCTGANVTGARIAGSAPNQYAYRFTGAASVTAIGFGQRIEAANCYHLAGTTATLSVNLANSVLTSVTWTAYYANSTDSFGTLASPTRTQIATGTFTVSSALSNYSAAISIPAAATTGIEIVFSVGAQTSGTWTIGNAQLEVGSKASAFERRPYGMELALCQRYYEKSYAVDVAPGTNTNPGAMFHIAATDGSNNIGPYIQFKVTKRLKPTTFTPYTIGGGSGIWAYARSGASGTVAVDTTYLGAQGGLVFSSVGAAWTAATLSGHWTADAEL